MISLYLIGTERFLVSICFSAVFAAKTAAAIALMAFAGCQPLKRKKRGKENNRRTKIPYRRSTLDNHV